MTPPVITSAPVTTTTVGQSYSYDVNATGNPAPTYSLTAEPQGMSIDQATGVITWTPGASGSFGVTVEASNGVGTPATQSFTIAVSNVTSDHTITATFRQILPVRIFSGEASAFYSTLNDACNGASEGDIIEIRAVAFYESLDLHSDM